LELFPQAKRGFEFFLGAREIFLLGLRIFSARRRAETMPENADENIPACRLELIENHLLRTAHVWHDFAPVHYFNRQANMVGQWF